MGLLGSLFGKKAPEPADRCMECGMTGGRHTDWCPAVDSEPAGHPEPGGDGATAAGDDAAGASTGPAG